MIQKAHKSRVQNNILFQIQSLIIKGEKKVLISPESCSTRVAPSDFYTVETKLMLLSQWSTKATRSRFSELTVELN